MKGFGKRLYGKSYVYFYYFIADLIILSLILMHFRKQRADTMYSSTLKYITVLLSLLAIPCFGIYDFCEDNTIAQGKLFFIASFVDYLFCFYILYI